MTRQFNHLTQDTSGACTRKLASDPMVNLRSRGIAHHLIVLVMVRGGHKNTQVGSAIAREIWCPCWRISVVSECHLRGILNMAPDIAENDLVVFHELGASVFLDFTLV